MQTLDTRSNSRQGLADHVNHPRVVLPFLGGTSAPTNKHGNLFLKVVCAGMSRKKKWDLWGRCVCVAAKTQTKTKKNWPVRETIFPLQTGFLRHQEKIIEFVCNLVPKTCHPPLPITTKTNLLSAWLSSFVACESIVSLIVFFPSHWVVSLLLLSFLPF